MGWDKSQLAKTDIIIVAGNLTADSYCKEILHPVLILFLHNGHARMLQQDNVCPYTACQTWLILQLHSGHDLPNPVIYCEFKHRWDPLGRQVRKHHDVNNVQDLKQSLCREWDRTIIVSLRHRCTAVITYRGGHTQYSL